MKVGTGVENRDVTGEADTLESARFKVEIAK